MTEKNWDMYDYILESKKVVRDIVDNQESILKDTLKYCENKRIDQIYILGSGTSYHASYAAKKVIEDVLQIKVFVMYPMEFVDNERVFNGNTLVIGISHAGRSSSTIRALDKAKEQGFYTIAATAETGRPIVDHADVTLKIEVGNEFAGPKTKGFIGSIATLSLLGLNLAVQKELITDEQKQEIVQEMISTTDNIPDIAQNSWDWYKENREELLKSRRIIVLGYDSVMAAMLEGTLKVLEAVRFSVVGYELEEFMHGVYHSIDKDTYLIALAPKGKDYPRLLHMFKYFEDNRNAKCYIITADNEQKKKENFVYPFVNNKYFATMEYVVPLQVLARKMSLDMGIDCNLSEDPNFHKNMGSYTY